MSGVELSRDLLVDLGGWDVLKEARVLVDRGCVKEVIWHDKVITGVVETGGRALRPRLDLAAAPFAENRCSVAPTSKWPMVCAHAIVCAMGNECPSAVEAGFRGHGNCVQSLKSRTVFKSFVLSEGKGIPLRFVSICRHMEGLLQGGR